MKKIITEAEKVDVEALKQAIRTLESPKIKRDRERTELFGALYPDVRDQLEAGVSKSAIVKRLAENGVSIPSAIFDDLLEAEAKRRGEPVPGKEVDVANQGALSGESTAAPQTRVTKQEVA